MGEPVIEKGRQKYKNVKWFLDKPLEYLAQGDVIGDFNFKCIDCDGYEREFTTSGMLLSNTCDASRDENILLVPLIPFDTEKLKTEHINEYDLFNNKIFQILSIYIYIIFYTISYFIMFSKKTPISIDGGWIAIYIAQIPFLKI